MKKVWYLLVVVTIALASCQKDNIVQKLPAPPYLNTPNEREYNNYGVYPFRYWESNDTDDSLKYFRTCKDNFLDVNSLSSTANFDPLFIPSRIGFDDLKISGSGQINENSIQILLNQLRQFHLGSIAVVDLRSETHGYFNGRAVYLAGNRSWGNMGKSIVTIVGEERDSLFSHLNDTLLIRSPLNNYSYVLWNVENVNTEEEVCQRNGLIYKRIPSHDYAPFPCDAIIEEFVDFVRNLPPDTWLHFHCAQGKGRTTMFMVFYDMMRNPTLTLEDIAYRHYLIGGQFVMNDGSNTEEEWKREILYEKSQLMPVFYEYVKQNHSNNFSVSYSEWKSQTYE